MNELSLFSFVTGSIEDEEVKTDSSQHQHEDNKQEGLMEDNFKNSNFIAIKLNIQELSSWQQFFFEHEEILSKSIRQADINNDIS